MDKNQGKLKSVDLTWSRKERKAKLRIIIGNTEDSNVVDVTVVYYPPCGDIRFLIPMATYYSPEQIRILNETIETYGYAILTYLKEKNQADVTLDDSDFKLL